MQILKLAKSLNRFSIDDILILLDIEKEEIINVLSELENDMSIKKIGEAQYLYIKLINNIEVSTIEPIQPIYLMNTEDEIAIYNSASPMLKKKYINIYC